MEIICSITKSILIIKISTYVHIREHMYKSWNPATQFMKHGCKHHRIYGHTYQKSVTSVLTAAQSIPNLGKQPRAVSRNEMSHSNF